MFSISRAYTHPHLMHRDSLYQQPLRREGGRTSWERGQSSPGTRPPALGPLPSLRPYKGTTSQPFTVRTLWVSKADFAKWRLFCYGFSIIFLLFNHQTPHYVSMI